MDRVNLEYRLLSVMIVNLPMLHISRQTINLSMIAPQSSGTEDIRADIRQDATHPKKHPMRRMGSRAKHDIA
jgi:hypothetical protein